MRMRHDDGSASRGSVYLVFILATNCYLPHSWSGWYHCILDLGLIIVLDVTSILRTLDTTKTHVF